MLFRPPMYCAGASLLIVSATQVASSNVYTMLPTIHVFSGLGEGSLGMYGTLALRDDVQTRRDFCRRLRAVVSSASPKHCCGRFPSYAVEHVFGILRRPICWRVNRLLKGVWIVFFFFLTRHLSYVPLASCSYRASRPLDHCTQAGKSTNLYARWQR